MAELSLTKLHLTGGVWSGVLSGLPDGAEAPRLRLLHEAVELAAPSVTPRGDGSWQVEVPIPAERLSDGVQTFVIAGGDGGATLASVSFLCGEAMTGDIRAEIDLLRDELDMLKRAFRRHCVETAAD